MIGDIVMQRVYGYARHATALLILATICWLITPAGEARAASAVAWADDGAYGYAYDYRTEREAVARAMRSCSARSRRRCRILVSCRGGGYGAIALQRQRGYRTNSIGASCGYRSKRGAFMRAVNDCNRAAGMRSCGAPRTAWMDRAS